MTAISTGVYRLGPVESIPAGEGRNFLVDRMAIAIFRTRAGELFATQAHCPHRGGPLADGLMGGGRIVCPFHSYAFDLATGEALARGCPALRTYRVWVDEEGEICTSLDEGTGAGE